MLSQVGFHVRRKIEKRLAELGNPVITSKTRRKVILKTLLACALAMLICTLASSAYAGGTTTHWFAPVMLTGSSIDATGPIGSFEAVLGVTSSAGSGPFQYTYWITNNGAAAMSDFFFTCFGVKDLQSFTNFMPLSGTRMVSSTGQVYFIPGSELQDWGHYDVTANNMQVAVPGSPREWYHTSYDEYLQKEVNDGCEFNWMALDSGLTSGNSIGFAFTSIYGPSDVASDIASTTAIRSYNGDVYGPDSTSSSDIPPVPEWSSVLLAMSGLGGIQALKMGLRKRSRS